MKTKFFKLTICFIMCGGIMTFLPQESYCHQTSQPHIHIKGKITDADGKSIVGVRLRLERAGSSTTHVSAPFVVGLPTDTGVTTEATESGGGSAPATYLTSSTGEYVIILKFAPGSASKQTSPNVDVSLISIDRSKMAWDKPGYVVKPK